MYTFVDHLRDTGFITEMGWVFPPINPLELKNRAKDLIAKVNDSGYIDNGQFRVFLDSPHANSVSVYLMDDDEPIGFGHFERVLFELKGQHTSNIYHAMTPKWITKLSPTAKNVQETLYKFVAEHYSTDNMIVSDFQQTEQAYAIWLKWIKSGKAKVVERIGKNKTTWRGVYQLVEPQEFSIRYNDPDTTNNQKQSWLAFRTF